MNWKHEYKDSYKNLYYWMKCSIILPEYGTSIKDNLFSS